MTAADADILLLLLGDCIPTVNCEPTVDGKSTHKNPNFNQHEARNYLH